MKLLEKIVYIMNFLSCIACVYFAGNWLTAVSYCVLLSLLSILSILDFKDRKIPNLYLGVLLSAKTVFIVIELFFDKPRFFRDAFISLIGLLIFSIVGIIFFMFFKDKIGAGDIKLLAVLGLYLGIYRMLAVCIILIFLLLIICFLCRIFKKEKTIKRVPMTPALLVPLFAVVLVDLFLSSN